MRKWIGDLFMVLGVCCMLGAAGLFTYNVWESKQAGVEMEEILVEVAAVIPDTPEKREQENPVEYVHEEELPYELYKEFPEKDMPTTLCNGVYYIGMMEIPSLDMTFPVAESSEYKILKKSPGRFDGSLYTDDLIICAHNFESMFGPLRRMKLGEKLIFTDVEGHRFEYTLEWVDNLAPTMIEELHAKEEGAEWDLSLYTCTLDRRTRYVYRFVRVRYT